MQRPDNGLRGSRENRHTFWRAYDGVVHATYYDDVQNRRYMACGDYYEPGGRWLEEVDPCEVTCLKCIGG